MKTENVREALPGFRPPQSWRYAKENELEWLLEIKLGATASPHAPDAADRTRKMEQDPPALPRRQDQRKPEKSTCPVSDA